MTERGFEWREGRTIPWSEIRFEQELGGGPGGQHVNRTASRVALIWAPGRSKAFSLEERARLLLFLANRINTAGELRLRSGSERSAHRNRRIVLESLGELIQTALRPRKRRVPTKPSRGSKKRRRDSKEKRSQLKQNRRRPQDD